VLQDNIESNPSDLLSRHQLAAWRVLEGDYEEALNQLLEIMKKDRSWQDESAKKGMLAIFDMIPGEAGLVGRFRRQMFNLLH
jgi:putative thioredoxin